MQILRENDSSAQVLVKGAGGSDSFLSKENRITAMSGVSD